MSMVKSAQRVIEILEFFEREQRPASANEIAVALGYPISSASMLISTMTRMGYLSLDSATRKLCPTLRVGLLGGWIHTREGGYGRAEFDALVQDANRMTGLTAAISTLNGMDLQYIHVLRAPAVGFLSLRPSLGALRPITRCAAGLVLISQMDEDRIRLLVRKLNAVRRQNIDLPALMDEIERIRARGYAMQSRQTSPDVGDVAVRLPGDDVFQKPLVLSVAGAAPHIEARSEALGHTLRELAAGLACEQHASAAGGCAAGNAQQGLGDEGPPSAQPTEYSVAARDAGRPGNRPARRVARRAATAP